MSKLVFFICLIFSVFKLQAENNLYLKGGAIPFTCDSSPYLTRGNNTTDSRLETIIDISGGSITFNSIIPTVSGVAVNGIGYNVLDDFIYGVRTNTGSANEIIKVASNGYFNLGAVLGLSNTSYFSGTMDESGFLYLKAGGNTVSIYKIDITDSPPTLDSTLALSSGMRINDMAYNPLDGMIYTVTESGQLKKFDLTTGVVTDIGGGGLPTVFGAIYIDKNGIGYGLSNTGSSGLHRIDLTLGTSQKLATYPGSVTRNDGAFCTNQSLLAYDYGDAPASYGTLIADNGPGHIIPSLPIIYLGSVVPDVDTGAYGDGTDDNFDATDDNVESSDDEDGAMLPIVFTENLAYSFDVEITGNGFFNAWIDWNKDGVFDVVTELVTTNDQIVTSGTVTVSGTVPATATAGVSYARFRVCSNINNCNTPLSIANDGEVEDYQVHFGVIADVAVTASLDTVAPFISGQPVQFSIDIINNGPASATDIEVTSILTNLTVQSVMSANCLPANSFPCTINSLVNSGSESIIVTALITAPSIFDFAVSVSNFEVDPDSVNDISNAGDVASGQPFTCDSTPYLVLGENPDSSRLDEVADIAGGLITFNNLIATDVNVSVNGIGYNVVDDYIYGARSNGTVGTNQLIQVSSNGFANIGAVAGLPIDTYHAGTMDHAGFLYLKATNMTSEIFKISINGVSATFDSVISLSTSLSFTDFIFNPIDGDFYTVDNQGQMYKFSLPSGDVVAIGMGGLPSEFGSFYIDVDGAAYGFDNRSSVGLHRLNLVDGTSQQLATYSNSVSRSDGTMCPNASLLEFDYGDAPDSYSTLIASSGPGHIVPFSADLYLGLQAPDSDDDGFSDGVDDNLDATDDNQEGLNDEDGAAIPATLTGNALYSIDVLVTGNGVLNAWIDWNQDGVFDSITESIVNDQAVSTGTVVLSAYSNSISTTGISYARFRLCGNSGECNTPNGLANDGEVEDYQVMLVADIDSPPVALVDDFMVTEDNPVTVLDVLLNDTDADGGTLLIQSITQPVNGIVVNGINDLNYLPNENYCNEGLATDDFTYTLNGGSTALVSVRVNCVDDLPIAVNDSFSLLEDSATTDIDVLINDSDLEGDNFTIISSTQPTNGVVVINSTSLSYTPNADYCNDGLVTDDFMYEVSGGDMASVAVIVDCVNDTPSFDMACDIDASSYVGSNNTIARFYNFTNLTFGPENENIQIINQITHFIDDPQGIISQFDYDVNGFFTVDFSLISGVATIGAFIQDSGGTEFGGNDTSTLREFNLIYSDLSDHTDRIFKSSFEFACEPVSLNHVE